MPLLRSAQRVLDAPALVVEMDAQEAPDPLKCQAAFTEHIPDKCACRWVGYKDISGWFLQETRTGCLVHRKKEEKPGEGSCTAAKVR
jgi:hypothetical protein